ncbi:MAG: type II toxin-antitoxin system RnlA family toxin [Bacteroidales bacterium]
MGGAQRYSLDTKALYFYIRRFAEEKQLLESLSVNEEVSKLVVKLEKTILNCFFKGGQVSFQVQGKNTELGNLLRDFLIDHASLHIADAKNITIKHVNESDLDLILEFLEEEKYIITEKDPASETICKMFDISSKHYAHLTVTYYKNGTLLAQGRITSLMADFISITAELFCDKPENITNEVFAIHANPDKLISEDLNDHVPDKGNKLDGKIEKLIVPSLILYNNMPDMPDYSCCIQPLFRGIEGIMKKRINEDIPGGIEHFGEIFQKQNDKYVILGTCSIFSAQESQPFCNLYTFFKKHRDKLSHADNVVETTTIIEDRGMCFDIITNGFRFINDYCKHWN